MTGAIGDYQFTTVVKDIQGDWSRVEISFFCENDGVQNIGSNQVCDFKIGLYDETPAIQDFSIVDLILLKDNTDTITGIGNGPYDITNSKLLGKSICTVGDSITLGGNYALRLQHDYGLSYVYNCGQSGRRIVDGANSLYQDLVSVESQPANIITIMSGANDNASPIGDIDSTDGATYYGGWNNYLTELLDNLPAENEKVILLTAPIIVGTGNTIAQGKAAFETQFINMANAVKALGVKYNLPVCDLHSLSPLTFENSAIFLSDKVHWSNSMHDAVGSILGKFINDLF